MSAAPPNLVYDYLVRQGMSPPVIQWKYFDEAFNRGRERGYVWLRHSSVSGFIGLIPLTLASPTGYRGAVWTCDWSVEHPIQNPGVGVMLLKRAHADFECVLTLGGNDLTRSILPRMGIGHAPEAAISFHLFLRLEPFLSKLEGRFSFLPTLSRTGLAKVPIRIRKMRGGANLSAQRESGVSPSIENVFAKQSCDAYQPCYGFNHLSWQLGRCPGLTTKSYSARTTDTLGAAAVAWCSTANPRHWRASVRGEHADDVEAVLASVIRRLHQERASLLSVLASAGDAPSRTVLKRLGFWESRSRVPLFVHHQNPGSAVPGPFHGLSYLDSDLGYRFGT